MTENHAPTAKPTLLGRLAAVARLPLALGKWVIRKPLLGVPLVLTGLLAALALAYVTAKSAYPTKLTPAEQLAQALTRLDAGEFVFARQSAAEMRGNKELTYEELGGPMFVLGAVMFHDAEEHEGPQQQQLLYRIAARYLEEARDRGFPEEREAQGLRLLGQSLFASNRFPHCIPVLEEAAKLNPEHAPNLRWALAEACLKLPEPNWQAALTNIDAYLADEQLPPGERHAGLLKQAEVRLAMGDAAGCRRSLAELPDTTPMQAEALVLEARALLHEVGLATSDEATANQEKVAAALAALEQVQPREGPNAAVSVKAHYLIGVCRLKQEDLRGAEEQFHRVRQSHFGSEEAFAATLQIAQLAQRQNRSAEALALLRKLLPDAPGRDTYHNPWLPLAEVQRRLTTLAQELMRQGDFEDVISLTAILPPLVAEDEALALKAQSHSAWAHRLHAEANHQSFLQAAITHAEAREQDRQAGQDYSRLAELRFATRFYEEDLWNSATSFLAGQAYHAAARRFRQILKHEMRRRRPEVLVGLGEAQLALGQASQAAEVLEQCLRDYSKHPSSYRARLLAASAQVELGELEEAKRLLNDNLYNFSLTPESADWRDSIFVLGGILAREGLTQETKSRLAGADSQEAETQQVGLAQLEQAHLILEEAIKVLTEAVRRFPSAPQTLEARYYIAESYRHSAKLPRKRLATTAIETTRVALNRQIQQDLGAALEEYGKLLAQLDHEQTTQQRNPLELGIIRNCYFGRADALFDLGRYDEALFAYSAATNRYQAEPEALEAYAQIAACYRRQHKPAEARGTLEQAKVVLKRIRTDANFTRTTRYTREEWGELLTWLGTL